MIQSRFPRPLPRLMVAPNGARRSQTDHPAIPITDADVITAILACQGAGADGAHLHLRDESGAHLLDVGRYQALLEELSERAPDLYLQVTSESVGLYGAEDQRAMIHALKPDHVSVAMREMVRDPGDWAEARAFYDWAHDAQVGIQHILYTPDEARAFVEACAREDIAGTMRQVIFVLGSYATGSKDSQPIESYLVPFEDAGLTANLDWMVCAFGTQETASVLHAASLGGKARVGFENSLWNADGSLAKDNAERVREVDLGLRAL